MFATFGNSQLYRFSGARLQSTIPLNCVCGTVFRINRTIRKTSARTTHLNWATAVGEVVGVAPAPSDCVLTSCPACGARRPFVVDGGLP
jgi:hypothetical protein